MVNVVLLMGLNVSYAIQRQLPGVAEGKDRTDDKADKHHEEERLGSQPQSVDCLTRHK